MIKLSVNETKWRSLLARTRALSLYISFWIFNFGPVKLPGLSRNGPLDKNLPPPKKKTAVPNFRAFWILTTLETPKNIFYFINNIMQNDNFRLFWKRKKSCVNQATQPRSQGSLLPVPKEREPGNEVKSHPPNKLAEVFRPKNPQNFKPKKSFDHFRHLKSWEPPWGRMVGDSLVKHTVGAKERQSGRCPYVIRPS